MSLARLAMIPVLAAAFWLASHAHPEALRAARAQTAPDSLPDGTVVRHLRLTNGLRVVTRDVPGCGAIAISVAYGLGTDHDAEGREGLTTLLANAAFRAAAGEIPERDDQALDSARPMGWNVEVTRRATRFTEIASLQQFPGVLHQVALRMRGVTISPKVLAATQSDVRGRLARNYRDVPASALYYQVREIAAPGGYARAERYASGRGIEKVTIEDLRRVAGEWLVPANAVLSLAGDLKASGLDLDRVLQGEFGAIPAGKAPAQTSPARPDSALYWVDRTDLDEPIGVIGIITPALSDTLHPSLFLHSIMIGSAFSARWPRTKVIPSRFQYSIIDDPELVRIYPIVTASDYEIGIIRESYLEAMLAMTQSQIRPEEFYSLQAGVRWLIGGPMTRDMRQRMATDRGLLMTLATSAATRELSGGEDFWREYRRRYDLIERPNLAQWADYFTTPANMAQLMYRMAEKGAGK